ncbi:MAG TPA: F0F1 ATP synthase subunit epsilon, partial [Firmicutes bacterium]|nr:F0F1 ATP synthase subunit epsilon [Bacillota bacterium]
AEERLRSRQADVDVARAQISLQKALLRLKVANDE